MSCHPERSEGSVNTKWMYFSLCSTTRQILRDAQNDTLVGNFHFDGAEKVPHLYPSVLQ